VTGSRLAVVIPAGPGDTPVDTLESVFCYSNPELVVVIDDTRGRGIDFTHEKVVVLPAVAHGGWGGLWVNLAMGFRYAIEHAKFDVLIRLDTDALLLGPGLAEAAAREFATKPEVGALGAYRFGPDGSIRDWAPARRAIRAETGVLGLRHPARRRTLRALVASAADYVLGEHALGGVVMYRSEMLHEMHRRDLLNFPELVNSRLGEDHIFGLLTAVSGYRTADFSRPEDPMAVRWKGLPSSPEELLRAEKLVVHSIRFWNAMPEQDIRANFAAARGRAISAGFLQTDLSATRPANEEVR
jgi:hypothetical protein